MKKLLLATFVFVISFGSMYAQQPVRRTQQPPPRQAPYVKKTDYKADMEALEANLKGLEATSSKLRSERDSARAIIDLQTARLDSIEQILSETSLETQLTSDSLSITSFSLANFMNRVDSEQDAMREEIGSIEKALMLWLPVGGLLMLLLIGGGIWHSGRKTTALGKQLKDSHNRMQAQMTEQRDDLNERLAKIEDSFARKISSAENNLNRKITDTHSTLDLKVIETKTELDNKISGEVKSSKKRFEELNQELEDRVSELRNDLGNRPTV